MSTAHGIDTGPVRTSLPDTSQRIEPPVGIAVAVVKSINVQLQISRYSTTSTTNLKRKRSSDSSPTSEHTNKSQHGCNHTANRVASQDQILRTSAAQANAPTCKSGNRQASSVLVSPTLDSPVKSEDNAFLQASLAVLTQNPNPILMTPCPPSSQLVTFAELTEVVDLSLRFLMFNSRKAMPRRFMPSSTTHHTKKLDQISPAIFSPGYLQVLRLSPNDQDEDQADSDQAISHRRYLLSVVAATIVGIEGTTSCVSLRQTIQRLRNNPSHRYLPGLTAKASATPSDGLTLSEAIEVRLWFLLQQSLYNENACSKLKSFSAKGRALSMVNASPLLDPGTSQAAEDIIKSTNSDEGANVFLALLDQVQSEEVLHGTQCRNDDLLDDRSDIGEENLAFVECQRHEDVGFGAIEEWACNTIHGNQEDEDLFSIKLEPEKDLLSEACGFLRENEGYEDLSWTDIEDGESLLDGARDHVHEEGDDEDLFWGDLGDQEDLPHHPHTSASVSYNLSSQGMTLNSELLDNPLRRVPSLCDESPELEDSWPERLDVSNTNSIQGGDLDQELEMLLEI